MTTALDATARRDLYALVARLFAAEVDVPLYRALRTHDALGFIDQELGALGEEQALEVFAVEFCRLFVGPQPLCVPYASAYRGEALLGGRARTRLEAFLHAIDFVYDATALRLASPDHLAIELAVLAHLYAQTDTAAIATFLDAHVLSWVPDYCQDVGRTTTLSLYRNAARLVVELLATEAQQRAS